jgi:hypothetical protein
VSVTASPVSSTDAMPFQVELVRCAVGVLRCVVHENTVADPADTELTYPLHMFDRVTPGKASAVRRAAHEVAHGSSMPASARSWPAAPKVSRWERSRGVGVSLAVVPAK